MFYWMIRVEVDCCISIGWLSIYVYFEVCLFTCHSQVQEIDSFVCFICGVVFYVIVDLIYVCADNVPLDGISVSGNHLGYPFSTRNSNLHWRHNTAATYDCIKSVPMGCLSYIL